MKESEGGLTKGWVGFGKWEREGGWCVVWEVDVVCDVLCVKYGDRSGMSGWDSKVLGASGSVFSHIDVSLPLDSFVPFLDLDGPAFPLRVVWSSSPFFFYEKIIIIVVIITKLTILIFKNLIYYLITNIFLLNDIQIKL